jgi:hypothetical protein
MIHRFGASTNTFDRENCPRPTEGTAPGYRVQDATTAAAEIHEQWPQGGAMENGVAPASRCLALLQGAGIPLDHLHETISKRGHFAQVLDALARPNRQQPSSAAFHSVAGAGFEPA